MMHKYLFPINSISEYNIIKQNLNALVMENNAIFVTEPEIFKTHLVKRLDVLSMNDGYTLKLTFNEMNGKGELGFFGKLETINNAIQGDLLLYTKEM